MLGGANSIHNQTHRPGVYRVCVCACIYRLDGMYKYVAIAASFVFQYPLSRISYKDGGCHLLR